ncbi:Clp protease N-terminal domain-containing protein [Nonomuraea sp. 3-1Str]|uniref:Clp protease N-terminal domain-containing protein n=1 Tax=Nonomuraea sp. 3-1Str TaxID=2929801 RepID=UPI00286FFC8F|nr:Clp protease N-terminal domain-containing protein [Nonomuraea sp. 3-1Str]
MAPIDHYINTIIERGADEAREDGSAVIEARHLLLGMATLRDADTRDAVVHEALASAGLDHRAIREALDKEYEHSLGAAGVSPATFGHLPEPSRSPERPSQLGASAKLALERGFSCVARKKDLRPGHLLLGVLRAEAGTVPRALTLAGIDREGLMERLQRALAQETPA